MKSNSITRFIFEHRYAICIALLVAFIAGFPQIIVRHAIGSADRGIPYLVNDSEGEYLSRVHEILDGHWSVSSPMMYEYKDAIALMPPTGEFVFYALPVKLTGLSLSEFVTVSKFLYPTALFFFAYLLILSLLDRNDRGAKLSAIAGALLIVVGYDAYDYRNFLSTIIHGKVDPAGLLWNRLVNPITGAMLLMGYLWLLSRNTKERSRWWEIGGSGLVLAVMSGYIFSFALGLSISSLLGVYFLLRKNWSMVWRVSVPVVVALVLNALYFAGVFMAMRGTASGDPGKAGMLLTHEPLINLISLASLIGVSICFVLFFRKDTSGEHEKRWWFFSLATLVASELVYNQQLISGRTVWPQHFVQYTTPLSMVLVVVIVHNVVRPRSIALWRIAIVTLLIVAALFGWRGFQAASHDTIPKYTELQSYADVFDYLNTHAPKDCVVYVSVGSDYSDQINRFIPAFTACNVYHTYYLYGGIPAERIMFNYLLELRLQGVKPQDVNAFYRKDPFLTTSYFFRDWNDMLCNNMSGCGDKWLRSFADRSEIDTWFASTENDVEQQYRQFLKGDIYSQLIQYHLDYFVVDTELQSRVNDKRYPFLSLKGKFGSFTVYGVNKPPQSQ